jgi:small GTP-binding protein
MCNDVNLNKLDLTITIYTSCDKISNQLEEWTIAEFKIMFVGLANAGKSSILLILDDRADLIPTIPPTLGVVYKQFNVAGFQIVAWDVGGQKQYRKKAILESNRSFEGLQALFFVISVEEPEMFGESVEFLKEIIKLLDTMNVEVPIAVCVHKMDPHRTENRAILKNLDAIQKKLSKVLKKRPYQCYSTSIYDPPSIIKAFHDTIEQILPHQDILQTRLQEIATEHGSPMTLLLDGKNHLIGEWHEREDPRVKLDKFTETCLVFARVISKRVCPEFCLLNFDENCEIFAVPFPVGDQAFLIFMQLDAGTILPDSEIVGQILNKREEFAKLLHLLQE